MTNEHQNQTEQMKDNKRLISYCGLYCGACPTFTSGKCEGCRGDSPKCGVGMKKCPVKHCCIENRFFTCADCTKYTSTKECKKYNPMFIRFGEWISGTKRSKGIEMMREKGHDDFLTFMTNKNWLTFKIKDTYLNKKLGKKVNE